jgi:cytochrome bd-type quinol oxidase subunit 2
MALDGTRIGIAAGLALSGIASLVSTYDAIAKKDNDFQSDTANQAQKTRFIVLISLSGVAFVLGIILGFVLKKHPWTMISSSLGIGGAVGIIYSLVAYYRNSENWKWISLAGSWGAFIMFGIAGFIMGSGVSDDEGDGVEYIYNDPGPEY